MLPLDLEPNESSIPEEKQPKKAPTVDSNGSDSERTESDRSDSDTTDDLPELQDSDDESDDDDGAGEAKEHKPPKGKEAQADKETKHLTLVNDTTSERKDAEHDYKMKVCLRVVCACDFSYGFWGQTHTDVADTLYD